MTISILPEGAGSEISDIQIERLPGRIIKIGETKYTEEFFLAFDYPDPKKLYRFERINGVTHVTEVGEA